MIDFLVEILFLVGYLEEIAVLMIMQWSHRINLETFRSGTGVALDSLNSILQSIKKTL